MREIDDAPLEHRLRAVLKDQLAALPFDLTAEALNRRWERREAARRLRRSRRIMLFAAAAVLVAGGAFAAGSDLLRLPIIIPPAVATPHPSETFPIASGSAAPSASDIPVAGAGGVWIPVGSMVTARDDVAAVRLLDGRVLVLGGSGREFDPSTAELYDPASGTWSPTGSMLKPRAGFAPVVLPDGRVLAGDVLDGTDGNPDVYGSELYDPTTGTWSATGDQFGYGGESAVVLPDGTVFATVTAEQPLAGGALYDPATGTWTATAQRTNTDKGFGGSAVLLSDGKVLVAGGYDATLGGDPSFAFTDAAEVYDPAAGSWTEIANMESPGVGSLATLLPDGKALVATRSGPWEIYDPVAGTWTAVPEPSGYRTPSAVLLDGTVLVTGSDEACSSAALYDLRTASLTTVSSMPRCYASFTLLLDGTVLVAGGQECNGEGVCVSNASAALYVPAGMAMPSLPDFPDPAPPVFPSPTPVPTPLPPTAGPVPPNAQSWTVTVENRSSEPALLFVAGLGDNGISELVGSATPHVVPAGAMLDVTFLFPVDGGWIWVNPRPGEAGPLVNDDDIGIPGRILVSEGGSAGWLSP